MHNHKLCTSRQWQRWKCCDVH